MKRRNAFTSNELIVIVVILLTILALLLPAVQASREAARRRLCEDNLRRQGVSILKFNESRSGLPPATVGVLRPSFFLLLTPYLEEPVVWSILQGNSDECAEQTDGRWWKARSSDERKVMGSISIFHCPSRRSGFQTLEAKKLARNVWNNGDDGPLGPLCDYAIPMSRGVEPDHADRYRYASFNNYANASKTRWDKYWNPFDPNHYQEQHGPFRVALVERTEDGDADYQNWQSRDDLSRFADGTSNQILVGEKYIPISRVRQCRSPFPKPELWDCGILSPGDQGRQLSFARGLDNTGEIQQVLVYDPKDFADGHPFQYSFGSWHPGGCAFVMGDGSVRFINRSIKPTVLCQLGCVDDGKPKENWE